LFERAAALDKHGMVAEIDAANPASLRLHARLGFERAGTLREVGIKFGRWLDLVFMQRFLGTANQAHSRQPARGLSLPFSRVAVSVANGRNDLAGKCDTG